MSMFANPALLLLVLGLPLLVWWWQRRRRAALSYPQIAWFTQLPAGTSRLARWGGTVLRTLALLLLITALAGPRWPEPTPIPTEGIAIEMLVDVSGSMAERDFRWRNQPLSRLEAVKKVFHLFVAGGDGPDGRHLEGRPQDLVGLVTFATWPESPCPLTLSHQVLLHLLDEEQPRTVPTEQTTNIGDAIAWGLHRLQSAPTRRKVMVLLSDGEHNVPPPALKPRQAAQLAAGAGIPIYTIDAAGEGPAEDPLQIRAHGEETLKAVAHITGGQYFRAGNTQALLDVYQQIDQFERQRIQSFEYRRYREGFVWFGLASVVLWIGVFVLERTLWRRLP